MRIIGGRHRGRKLIAPPGPHIRPTTDRMRESIFNILQHGAPCQEAPLVGAHVLDAFAGTGALGLEALSRGAGHVTFFDAEQKSLALVRKNVALLGAEDQTTIRRVTLPTLPAIRQQYQVVFLDPPYNLNIISELLIRLDAQGYLSNDCIIVAEHLRSNQLIFNDNFNEFSRKSFGQTDISFLQKTY